MRKHRILSNSLLMAAILSSVAVSPARPDAGLMHNNTQDKKLCYCQCDHAPGSPMCHHMCELPKYEHRSWATSCHTPSQSEINQTSPAQPTPSKPTNRIEHARLK